MIKRLLVMLVGVCVLMIIPLQIQAQQAPVPDDQKQSKFQELKAMRDAFRKEEAALRQQMKEEVDKMKLLREKFKIMREEHKKALDEERVKLGFSVPPAAEVKQQ